MINSKDYVKPGTPVVYPDSCVPKLKTQLESLVENGREQFAEHGYIPFDMELQKFFFDSIQNDLFTIHEVTYWLQQHDWFVARISHDTLKLALFAVQE